jgi:hypothetical protein
MRKTKETSTPASLCEDVQGGGSINPSKNDQSNAVAGETVGEPNPNRLSNMNRSERSQDFGRFKDATRVESHNS